jgi:ubiquinone biosynthesis protein UbiJ
MADVTAEFFDRLAERGIVPGFARTTGSVRFDLTRADQTEYWRVEFRRGVVTVDRAADAGHAADCVVRTDASTFDDLATGRANVMATLLRGRLEADGEPELLTRFQRLFPPPVKRDMATSSARTIGKRRG